MDLNLNQLRAFFYASKRRTISIAAEKLFISQPAASMKIKALEDQYCFLLFVRKKGGLDVTEAGRKLLGIADRIFELVEEAKTFLDRDRAVSPDGVSADWEHQNTGALPPHWIHFQVQRISPESPDTDRRGQLRTHDFQRHGGTK